MFSSFSVWMQLVKILSYRRFDMKVARWYGVEIAALINTVKLI